MNKLKRYVCTFVTLLISACVWAASSSQADCDDAKFYISLIASVVALIGTFVNYWSIKRKQFSTLVTSERLRFVKEWREYSARFCELLGDGKRNKNNKTIGYYYYKLIFMCNPTKPESYIDKEVVRLLEQLYTLNQKLCLGNKQGENEQDKNQKIENEQDIKMQELKRLQKRFVTLMQSNIAIEWHGITAESRKGHLSDEHKEDLRQEHYKDYLESV